MIFLLLLWDSILADNWISDLHSSGCTDCRQYYRAGANFTSVVTYQNSIIVGGRNALYDLSFHGMDDVSYHDKIVETDDYEYCIASMGQQPIDCHNYYTLLIKLSDTNLFVCGTSSFSPACGTRLKSELSYRSNEAKVNYISSNPYSSINYLRLQEANYTSYVGTEKGSNTGDFVIASVNMMPGSYAIKASTPTSTNFWLNSPKFIYSFETAEHVYFVFQEIAVEISHEIVYSRIARICKDDTGDTSFFFNKKFLTYSKLRLQCSYSQTGQAPYQFDRISGAYFHENYLYTVFSGSNTIFETGSVFCLFKMIDIEESFNGKYKQFEAGRWQDVMPAGIPFKCGADPNWTADQAWKYQMLAEVLKSEQVIHYSKDQLSSLDVFTTTIRDKEYKILHSGSKDGGLVRVGFHINRFSELEHIRHIRQNAGTGGIKKIFRDTSNSGDIYVLANDWITYVPLNTDCSVHTTCQSCANAFPGCGWCVNRALRSTCTRADQCNAKRAWKSAFEQCSPLADFAVKPENVTVSHKSEVVLDCSSTTNEGSYWINETGMMSSRVRMPLNGSLVIPSASQADNGCYVCELRGVSGVVSARACITVLIPPFFFNNFMDNVVEVEVGKDTSLLCNAGGSPAPTIMWRKMGNSKLPEGAYKGADNELRVIRAISDDAGEYQCSAQNSVGTTWREPIILNVISKDPNGGAMEQDPKDSNKSMVSLISIVSVVLVVILVTIVTAHCYCKRKTKQKKFRQLDQCQDILPGYSTYLDPRLTPIGSLRDNSLTSIEALRHAYSDTSTPRWLPPHTIMSGPLTSDHIPPPPYQQYFMERQILNNLQRGIYENVTHPNMQPTMQPPSPTERVPISFTHDMPYARVNPQGFYAPLNNPSSNPLNQSTHLLSPSANPLNSSSNPLIPTSLPLNPPTSIPLINHQTPTAQNSPVYSSASFLHHNALMNNTPLMNHPVDSLARSQQGPLLSSSITRDRPHVYDEIVVPEEMLPHPADRLLLNPALVSPTGGASLPASSESSVRPPLPPRVTRTPSRSPPAIPEDTS